MKNKIEKLIAEYERQWSKYGMGSTISYSMVVSDLRQLISEPVKAESISDHKQKEKICDCYNGESYRDGYFGTFCTKCNGRLQS